MSRVPVVLMSGDSCQQLSLVTSQVEIRNVVLSLSRLILNRCRAEARLEAIAAQGDGEIGRGVTSAVRQ